MDRFLPCLAMDAGLQNQHMTLRPVAKLVELGDELFAVDPCPVGPPDKVRVGVGRAILDFLAKEVLIERSKILDSLGYHFRIRCDGNR